MTIFEITCLPSILRQSSQTFDWILIVDRELPVVHLRRLESLVEQKRRAIIHRYHAADDLSRLEWLKAYVRGAPDYLITTNIDDDDAFGCGYVAALHSHLELLAAQDSTPLYEVLGTKRAIEWDLVCSSAYPLGLSAPWHRTFKGRPTAVSCGYSLLIKYPLCDRSVFGLPAHSFAEYMFDKDFDESRCRAMRQECATLATADGRRQDWRQSGFHDLAEITGPVVMTNHRFNDRVKRVYEWKPHRTAVTGPQSFPGVPIDWSLLRAACAGMTGG